MLLTFLKLASVNEYVGSSHTLLEPVLFLTGTALINNVGLVNKLQLAKKKLCNHRLLQVKMEELIKLKVVLAGMKV